VSVGHDQRVAAGTILHECPAEIAQGSPRKCFSAGHRGRAVWGRLADAINCANGDLRIAFEDYLIAATS